MHKAKKLNMGVANIIKHLFKKKFFKNVNTHRSRKSNQKTNEIKKGSK